MTRTAARDIAPSTAVVAPPAAPARWLVAGAAVLTHLCLGSVYAWSVFIGPLQRATSWDRPQITWAFSTAIAMLGFTAALSSRITQKIGPRASVMLSAVCFGIGMAGAGLACQFASLPILYGVFGVIGGIGLGLGYAPPVTTLIKWFPDRRGLATGLAVSGFGFGALIASKAGPALLGHLSCPTTFYIMAGAYAALIFASACVIRLPPAGYCPPGYRAPQGGEHAAGIPFAQAVSGLRFWLIWGMFFSNIAAGIMLVALASPVAQELAKLTAAGAATIVAVMGIFNGAGRLAWSALSDRLGRLPVFAGMIAIELALFFALLNGSPVLFAGAVWIIISCYGAGFAITPALIADTFGPRSSASLYGVALTAWSAAALLSPPLGAMLRERTDSYTAPLLAAMGFLVLALLMAVLLLIRRPQNPQT